jgi:hypothetical protein
MIHGGVQPDYLDDTNWWGDIEDFWIHAFYALVIVVRAGAERTGETVAVFVARLGEARGVNLQ